MNFEFFQLPKFKQHKHYHRRSDQDLVSFASELLRNNSQNSR